MHDSQCKTFAKTKMPRFDCKNGGQHYFKSITSERFLDEILRVSAICTVSLKKETKNINKNKKPTLFRVFESRGFAK